MKTQVDTTADTNPEAPGRGSAFRNSQTAMLGMTGDKLREHNRRCQRKPERPTFDKFTDQWTADKVARKLLFRVRYVPEKDDFYVWDGTHWREDKYNHAPYLVTQKLGELADEARKQAKNAPAEGERKKAGKFVRQAQGATFKDRVLRLLKEHPDITLTLEEFDTNPYILATPKGYYGLSDRSYSEPDPGELCSMCTEVGPQAGTPEMWLEYLNETMINDRELVDWLQRWLGYVVTGLNVEKYLLIGVGRTDSGKSVFMDVVSEILGSYHENIPQGTLLAKGGSRHPTDLAKIVGKRLATSSEVPANGARWRSDIVKQITGGDTISVRHMREDFYDRDPRCRIMLFSNHTPTTGNDPAMSRRIIFLPFDNKLPKEEQDKFLREKIVDQEAGKILHWIIEGARRYIDEGLHPLPGVVQQRTEEYRDAEDRLGRFIEDRCILDVDANDTNKRLYSAWQVWCQEQGYDSDDIGTQTAFTQMFRREAEEDYDLEYTTNAVDSATDKRGRGFTGIQVKTENVFDADEDPADKAVKESWKEYGDQE